MLFFEECGISIKVLERLPANCSREDGFLNFSYLGIGNHCSAFLLIYFLAESYRFFIKFLGSVIVFFKSTKL